MANLWGGGMVYAEIAVVMNDAEHTGALDYLKAKLRDLGAWLKPDPTDKPLVRVLKLFYKSIVLLVMIAFSPVILAVLLFVFFAAI